MLSAIWFAPDGSSTMFGDDPFALVNVEGISGTLAQPQTRQGVGQIGSTLIGSSVNSRVISMTVELAADDAAALWQLSQQLSGAMVTLPDTPLGTLRFLRDGMPDVDIQATPRQAPDVKIVSANYAIASLEFLCPYPFFKDKADSIATLENAGGSGMQFVAGSSIQFPFQIVADSTTQEVYNYGNVPAPILARIYGNVINTRLKNLTTGETLEISGTLDAGDYYEINTEYGAKSVWLYPAVGDASNVMSRVNLANSKFWQLKPGVNTIVFEADTNIGGMAVLFWRQRYGGI